MEGTNIFSNNRGSSSIRIDLHKVTKRAGVGDYKTHQKPRRSNLQAAEKLETRFLWARLRIGSPVLTATYRAATKGSGTTYGLFQHTAKPSRSRSGLRWYIPQTLRAASGIRRSGGRIQIEEPP